MQNIELNVEGMSCGHCVKAVEDSVNALAGISQVTVDLNAAKVNVAFDEAQVSEAAIKETIEEQGYDIK